MNASEEVVSLLYPVEVILRMLWERQRLLISGIRHPQKYPLTPAVDYQSFRLRLFFGEPLSPSLPSGSIHAPPPEIREWKAMELALYRDRLCSLSEAELEAHFLRTTGVEEEGLAGVVKEREWWPFDEALEFLAPQKKTEYRYWGLTLPPRARPKFRLYHGLFRIRFRHSLAIRESKGLSWRILEDPITESPAVPAAPRIPAIIALLVQRQAAYIDQEIPYMEKLRERYLIGVEWFCGGWGDARLTEIWKRWWHLLRTKGTILRPPPKNGLLAGGSFLRPHHFLPPCIHRLRHQPGHLTWKQRNHYAAFFLKTAPVDERAGVVARILEEWEPKCREEYGPRFRYEFQGIQKNLHNLVVTVDKYGWQCKGMHDCGGCVWTPGYVPYYTLTQTYGIPRSLASACIEDLGRIPYAGGKCAALLKMIEGGGSRGTPPFIRTPQEFITYQSSSSRIIAPGDEESLVSPFRKRKHIEISYA
jgi:hypothetical protein